MSRPIPRLFLIRHGETEWSLNGRHTGTTDIPLTQRGEEQISSRAGHIVGEGKLIDPKNLCHVFVSPRQRADRTFHLLFAGVDHTPSHSLTEEVREWDYGDYEGLLTHEINEKSPGWSIWKTGCPGGESAEAMCARVDSVIHKVHEIHRQYFEEGKGSRDVLIVAHGHFSRVLIARWVEFSLELGTHFNVEPAGVAVLSYNHQSLKEPALNGLNLYAI